MEIIGMKQNKSKDLNLYFLNIIKYMNEATATKTNRIIIAIYILIRL